MPSHYYRAEYDSPEGAVAGAFTRGLVGGSLGQIERTMAEKAKEKRRLRLKEEERVEDATRISDEAILKQRETIRQLKIKGFVEDTGDLQAVDPASQRIDIFGKSLVKPLTAEEIADRAFKKTEREFKIGEFERKTPDPDAPKPTKKSVALERYLKVRKELSGIEVLDLEDEALLADLKKKAFAEIGFTPPDLSVQESPIDAQNLPVGDGQELTSEMAMQFLAAAGGDKVQAKQMAEANGFLVPDF